MQKEVIFFDLDETLLVEVASVDAAFHATCQLAEWKYDVPADALHQCVKKRARELWYQMPTIDYCIHVGLSSWEGLWSKFEGEAEGLRQLKLLAREYQIGVWARALADFSVVDDELSVELSFIFCQERSKRHSLFPESLSLLQTLSHRYRLGLITNGAPDIQWAKIRGVGIQKFFEKIVIAGEIGCGKPRAAIFSCAMERLRTKGGDCLMVGDSLKNDIVGAGNSGITTVWINRNNMPTNPVTPDFTIGNLDELFQIL